MENNSYNDEPGYDYSGRARYDAELDKAKMEMKQDDEETQARIDEQIDRERREAANERGTKAASATYEIPQSAPVDRSAAMKEALSYAEKEYGNEIRSPKYPEGDRQGYEGYGFGRNGMENTIDDQEPEYYLPHEAIEALGKITSGVNQLMSVLTAKRHVTEVSSEAKLDAWQKADGKKDVAEQVSIVDFEHPGETETDEPKPKE